jgi:chemotaxis protein histidine kinase CheA
VGLAREGKQAMSQSKRILEQQLAEVAAGTRKAVDPYWQQAVANDEYRAAEADSHHKKKSLEAAAKTEQHTRDLAATTAETSRDTKALLRVTELRQRCEQEHHAKVESLEEDRLEVEEKRLEAARAFQDDMRKNAAQQLALKHAALKTQQREAQSREDAREEQRRLLEQQAHESRLQASPSYAAALGLRALKHLEDLQRDRREAEQILAIVPALLERLQAQRVTEQAHDAQRLAVAAAQAAGAHAAAQAEHHKALAAHESAMQSLARSRPAPPVEDQVLPAATEQALIRAAALNCGVQADFARLQRQVVDWLMAEPRAEATHAWFGRCFLDSPPEIAVDFDRCVMLDHQRRDGLGTVHYPGLGELPFGPAQAALVARLEAARRDVASFQEAGPDGLQPYRALALLLNAQLLPDGCGQFLTDDDATPRSFEARDALYEQAVNVVRTHQRASASLIQRELKIGHQRATRLMSELEAAGVVTVD